MEFGEIKKIVRFARSAGVKSLKLGDLSVEFKDEIIIKQPRQSKAQPQAEQRPAFAAKEKQIPEVPTLDEINNFIYGNTDEAH